jgi:hypothetical protein
MNLKKLRLDIPFRIITMLSSPVLALIPAFIMSLCDDSIIYFVANFARGYKIWIISLFAVGLSIFYPNVGWWKYQRKTRSTGPAAFYLRKPGKRYIFCANDLLEDTRYPFFYSNKKAQLSNEEEFRSEIKERKSTLNWKRKQRVIRSITN